MAKIHGISGSTRYLLKGTKAINGKKFETFDDITCFFNNYEEILASTEREATQQQDKIIAEFSAEEERLDKQVQEGIARRTTEVDIEIIDIGNRIETAGNFLWKAGYRIKYWIYTFFRTYVINGPFTGSFLKLRFIRNQKENKIANKPAFIKYECQKVIENHCFLTENKSFFFGAHGEEEVIRTLSQLPDEYHVLNDVILRFQRAIYWRKWNEYIRTSQIDHIVIGPTGIFLVETKNWKPSDIEPNSERLKWQVQRSGLALWYFLKNYYAFRKAGNIRLVVVLTHGSCPLPKLDKFIDVVSVRQLCDYISKRDQMLSMDEIEKLVRIIPWRSS